MMDIKCCHRYLCHKKIFKKGGFIKGGSRHRYRLEMLVYDDR